MRAWTPKTAIVLGMVALLALSGVARAENECGAPESGVEITCSPSNYDPSDGNIFYGPDKSNGDFTVRLTDGLALDYDRENPGDDAYIDPDNPERPPLYSAIWITPTETGYGYKGNISVVSSADVTSNARGISVGHYGESGALRLELRGGNFTTMGESAFAVHSHHRGAGDSRMIARNLTVNTNGRYAYAIVSSHVGAGDTNIDVRGSAISTTGEDADGILGAHHDAGDLTIDAQGLTVSTTGKNSDGIFGQHTGQGSFDLHVRGGAISTTGENALGILGLHWDAGDVTINAQALTVLTTGESADGIFGQHRGEGSLDLHVQGGAISTTGKNAPGIVGGHFDAGDVTIDVRDVTITTESTGLNLDPDSDDISAYGVYAWHGNPTDADGNPLTDSDDNVIQGTGNIVIGLTSSEIGTRGEGAHGIFAEHESGIGEIRITVDGGTIGAAGMEASGIRIGRLDEEGIVENAAALGEDGYRRQSVRVNGRVIGGSGEGAGVYLAGGGRVMIGPQGSLAAESGVAIRATGDGLDSAGATRQPKLYLDANLAGRRMASVIQGDVLNDGGETTIVVNGVTLYDEAAGATGLEVLNGAWDVTLRGRDPIAGRAFSPNNVVEIYAPRAAVYEALPGLLLRLNSRGPAGEGLTAPGSPAWVRVAGGAGRYTPVRPAWARNTTSSASRWKPGWMWSWGRG